LVKSSFWLCLESWWLFLQLFLFPFLSSFLLLFLVNEYKLLLLSLIDLLLFGFFDWLETYSLFLILSIQGTVCESHSSVRKGHRRWLKLNLRGIFRSLCGIFLKPSALSSCLGYLLLLFSTLLQSLFGLSIILVIIELLWFFKRSDIDSGAKLSISKVQGRRSYTKSNRLGFIFWLSHN